jgi:hypothetical protein
MKLIVTNNPLVYKNSQRKKILYLENQDYLDVLIKVRDYIHNNYQLLTHPLSSNFLADKTFYKTVVIEESANLNLKSIGIIEDAIILVRNSLLNRDHRINTDKIKKDLQFMDYEIIKQAL